MSNHYFKPGVSGNPNGRPKGSCTKLPSIVKSYVSERAETDFPIFYNGLINSMKKNEPWAYKTYSSILPKKIIEDSIVNVLKDKEIKTTADIMPSLFQMLSAPESYTLDEIMSIQKVLNNLKIAETIENSNSVSSLSNDKLTAIMNILESEEKITEGD